MCDQCPFKTSWEPFLSKHMDVKHGAKVRRLLIAMTTENFSRFLKFRHDQGIWLLSLKIYLFLTWRCMFWVNDRCYRSKLRTLIQIYSWFHSWKCPTGCKSPKNRDVTLMKLVYRCTRVRSAPSPAPCPTSSGGTSVTRTRRPAASFPVTSVIMQVQDWIYFNYMNKMYISLTNSQCT